MARHKTSTPAAPQSREDDHPAYIALMARLIAFRAELATQAKSRPTADVPYATLAMAADLMAQMARLMRHAVEARDLPVLIAGQASSFSETTIAFAQAHQAFDAFGKRKRFDRPVPQPATDESRNEVVRLLNVRIVVGIKTGYLIPTGGEFDAEKRRLSDQFTELVKRLELIADAEALPDVDEAPF